MKPQLEVAKLARLSKRMARVNPDHLDMGQWGYKTDCGTIGCLLGHAGLIPEFRALGLRTELKHNRVYYLMLNGHRLSGCAAGAKFFGLSEETSDMLFSPSWYSIEESEKPKLIADRIDTLIDVGEKAFAEMVRAASGYQGFMVIG